MYNAGTAYKNEMAKPIRGQSFVFCDVTLSNFLAKQSANIAVSGNTKTITFTEDCGNIYGITITFASAPSSVTVNGKSYTATAKVEIPDEIFGSTITIAADKDIKSIDYGTKVLSFTNTETSSTRWRQEVSPISVELPEQTYQIDICDYEGTYDWSDTDSLIYGFQEKQVVKFSYGRMCLGNIVRIPGGEYWLSAWAKTSNTLTLKAQTKIAYMEDDFVEGINEVLTGQAAAAKVVSYYNDRESTRSGQTVTVDASEIADVTLANPLPDLPCNQVLQMIANACRAAIYEDREGRIVFRRAKAEADDYRIGDMNVMEDPGLYRIEDVDTVDVTTTAQVPSQFPASVGKVDISITGTDVLVTLDSQIDATKEVKLSMPDATLVAVYSGSVVVNCASTGQLGIIGYPLTSQTATYRGQTTSSGGTTKTISNILVPYSDAYMEWLEEYLSNDVEYDVTYRGDPAIDPLDLIHVWDDEDDLIRVTVLELGTSTGMNLDNLVAGRRIAVGNTYTNTVIYESAKDPDSAIAELAANALTFQTPYELSADGTYATFDVRLYSNGVDISRCYPPRCFTWYRKTDTKERTYIGSGYTKVCYKRDQGYTGTIIGVFQSVVEYRVTTRNRVPVVIRSGKQVTAQIAED